MRKIKLNKKSIKERGVTLIALVVTIIVLLILAGVSIAMLTRTKWINYSSTKCKGSNRTSRRKRKR